MHPTQVFCEIRVVKKLESLNGFGPIVYYYEDGNNFYVFVPKNGEQGQHILHSTYLPKMQGLGFQHFLPKNSKNQKQFWI